VTLNITLVSAQAIYQCSDFRASVFDRATGTYRVKDDTTQKQVFLGTFRWNATVTFTGVASTSRIRVADWLAEQTRPMKGHVPFADLPKALAGAETWLRGVPAAIKAHTFVVAGYSSVDPIVALVSNFETVTGQQHPNPLHKVITTQFRPRNPQLIVTGAKAALAAEDRVLLLRRMRAEASADDMHALLADVIQRAACSAAAKNTISETCFTSHLLRDGMGMAYPHRLNESKEYCLRSLIGFRKWASSCGRPWTSQRGQSLSD
jgi:hypothetical protein